VAVSFIGEGNPEKTTELTQVTHWKTLSHNVVSSTPRHELGSKSQLSWL